MTGRPRAAPRGRAASTTRGPRARRSAWSGPFAGGLRLGLLLLVLGASPALAQYNVPSQTTGEAATLAIADDRRVERQADRPLGWELGASLDFVTRDASPELPSLKFTDLALFRVHALVAVGARAELFAGLDVLPKQPSASDEAILQSGLLGVRVGLGQRYAAYARAQAGPALGGDGGWLMGEAAVQARVSLADNVLFWESTFGGTYTQLLPDADERRRLWQAELLAATGVAVRDKRGVFATWLSFGFHFPLTARPLPSRPDPVTGRALDPQVRVGLALGLLVGVNPGLDLFLEGSILDRGDATDPRTTLPILAGGSDQRRLVFGFNRRFGARRR